MFKESFASNLYYNNNYGYLVVYLGNDCDKDPKGVFLAYLLYLQYLRILHK